MATTMTLTKRDGALYLEGSDGTASLEPGTTMRRGKIVLDGKTLPIEVNNPLRTGITVGGDQPVLRLDPQDGFVPGSSAPTQWQVSREKGRYSGTLTRGGDRIDLSVQRFHGKSVEVSVTGDWEQLELVALSACFALLARRRGDALRGAAVASASAGHGH